MRGSRGSVPSLLAAAIAAVLEILDGRLMALNLRRPQERIAGDDDISLGKEPRDLVSGEHRLPECCEMAAMLNNRVRETPVLARRATAPRVDRAIFLELLSLIRPLPQHELDLAPKLRVVPSNQGAEDPIESFGRQLVKVDRNLNLHITEDTHEI